MLSGFELAELLREHLLRDRRDGPPQLAVPPSSAR
jgi:hypothetical protein